jgi:hypothetical protein
MYHIRTYALEVQNQSQAALSYIRQIDVHNELVSRISFL